MERAPALSKASTWADTERSLAIVTPRIRREPTRSIAKGRGTSVRHLPSTPRDKHLSGCCSVEPQIVVGDPVSDTIKLLLECGPHASSNDEVSVVSKI